MIDNTAFCGNREALLVYHFFMLLMLESSNADTKQYTIYLFKITEILDIKTFLL